MPVPSGDSVPTVLLRHELPNGSSHIDWMIATDAAGEGPLMSFRLPARVDELQAGQVLNAERLPDHRCAYLEYEGQVSGGRGRVQRLVRGRAKVAGGENAMIVDVSWEEDERTRIVQILQLSPRTRNEWTLECRRRVIEDRSQ